MELLSALSLGELALSFSRVPLFPVFDLSYFIVSILYLKYEPGETGRRAGGGWHHGARGEDGESLDHGGDSSGANSEMQTDAGIMGFSHTGQATGRDVREGK